MAIRLRIGMVYFFPFIDYCFYVLFQKKENNTAIQARTMYSSSVHGSLIVLLGVL